MAFAYELFSEHLLNNLSSHKIKISGNDKYKGNNKTCEGPKEEYSRKKEWGKGCEAGTSLLPLGNWEKARIGEGKGRKDGK